MSITKNAAYFEAQLRPHLVRIEDRSLRATVEDLMTMAAAEEKKELEAKNADQKPRPDGDEFKRIAKKLKGLGLEKIEKSAGKAVKKIIEELLAYVRQLTKPSK